MSTFADTNISLHLDARDDQLDVRLASMEDFGRVSVSLNIGPDARVAFVGDPAEVLRHLDAMRHLVIDHLVATVGIPADPTGELLGDILREIGTELPSPLAHRIRSTIAGDQPHPTGRTTATALAGRQDWTPSHLATPGGAS